MGSPYTPNNTNLPTVITIPDDGDDLDAASVDVPLEGIADGMATLSRLIDGGTLNGAGAVNERCGNDWHLGAGSDYDLSAGNGSYSQNTAASTLVMHLELPNGAVFNGCTIEIDPADGHGVYPSPLPKLTIKTYERGTGGSGVVTLGETADPNTGNLAVYEAPHEFSVTGLAHTVNTELYRYVAIFTGEGSTNFVAGLKVWNLTRNYTVNTVDNGAA